MHTRLLPLVALLTSAVVGCDDPEVQSKVASLMEHGAVSAELECSVTKPFSKPTVTITRNVLKYGAKKFIDGACYVEFCMGTSTGYMATGSAASTAQCWTSLMSRSDNRAETCSILAPVSLIDTHPTYPFRLGIDGAHIIVEDGLLSGEFIEDEFNDNSPNCGGGSGSCNEVEPWFTHDITDPECIGRNLEAFGATP